GGVGLAGHAAEAVVAADGGAAEGVGGRLGVTPVVIGVARGPGSVHDLCEAAVGVVQVRDGMPGGVGGGLEQAGGGGVVSGGVTVVGVGRRLGQGVDRGGQVTLGVVGVGGVVAALVGHVHDAVKRGVVDGGGVGAVSVLDLGQVGGALAVVVGVGGG